MGVDAMGLRLASRPATVRVEAVGLRRGACGRTTVGSDGADDSDIADDVVSEGGGERERGKGGSGRSMRMRGERRF